MDETMNIPADQNQNLYQEMNVEHSKEDKSTVKEEESVDTNNINENVDQSIKEEEEEQITEGEHTTSINESHTEETNQENQENNNTEPKVDDTQSVQSITTAEEDIMLAYDRKKSHPIMDGHFINDGKICVWYGLWGMGVEGEIKGSSSDFRFYMKLNSEKAEGPQDGFYTGYFWMRINPPKRMNENNISMKFLKKDDIYLVRGEGQNRLGPFVLIGTYDPKTSIMLCEKYYQPITSHSIRHTHHNKPKPKVKPKTDYWFQSHNNVSYVNTRSGQHTSYLRDSSIIPNGLSREMSLCYKTLKRLMIHKWAGPFLQPVDPVALNIPDYFTIVKNPMDFGTISNLIENHVITNKEEFAAKVRQVFNNAVLYNKPDSDVYIMAHTLKDIFEKDYIEITGQVLAAGEDASKTTYYVPTRREKAPLLDQPPSIPKSFSRKTTRNEKTKNTRKEEMQLMSNLIDKLQGTICRMEKEISAKANKNEKQVLDNRPMTVEEKKALSLEINQLNGNDLAGIVTIIREGLPADSLQQEDIEIDLDTMPNNILRKMETYIKECKEAKKSVKRHRRTYNHAPHEKLIDFDDKEFIEDYDNLDDSPQEDY